ncbi:MAG TPA: glycogen debranching protein [Candidatus Limnocylindria bacterium]|nr:glycogen debranching protein [Candidatus Limnocylindria bacterium]
MLRANDVGGWTKPAPRLYPHQWSWDSAFIAIGLAHLDPARAIEELEHLFAAQWSDGRVPHIVFDPNVPDYWPGPDLWGSRDVNEAPTEVATSGLIQPPMHAIAVWRILAIARETNVGDKERSALIARARALYPKLLAWHRYLVDRRDPERTGLITVYHPWEGTDNTPRWDAALRRIDVGDIPPYPRTDVSLVDAAERPTKAEYDRYLWLVGLLRNAKYDDEVVRRTHPFLIKDVQCSAIFVAANDALAQIAIIADAPASERAAIAEWSKRSEEAVRGAWDHGLELALDFDLRAESPVRCVTSAGLCPLLVPSLTRDEARRFSDRIFGPDFAGAEGLAHPVVLSTGARSPEFRPRAYWRGPTWPVINWLLWCGLRAHGLESEAARLREANLALLARPAARFSEYFEPFTAEPLGSPDQSWTAAVALDWIAEG